MPVHGNKSRRAGGAARKASALGSWTPSRVIAHNIEEFRQRREWSQLWTVKQFARHGLTSWGRTGYAMAVTAVSRGRREREFTAAELLVFAQVFDVAIWTLFIPPPGVMVAVPGGPRLDV